MHSTCRGMALRCARALTNAPPRFSRRPPRARRERPLRSAVVAAAVFSRHGTSASAHFATLRPPWPVRLACLPYGVARCSRLDLARGPAHAARGPRVPAPAEQPGDTSTPCRPTLQQALRPAHTRRAGPARREREEGAGGREGSAPTRALRSKGRGRRGDEG